MSSVEDSELVRATLAGDRAGFDELVERHQIKIYNMALRVTGNMDDALDVSQAAFLKAYDHLEQFKKKARIATRAVTDLAEAAVQKGLDEINEQNPHPGGKVLVEE